MVEIISKSDGPRGEDAAAKHFIRENAATINKIANQLSGGRRMTLPGSEAPRADDFIKRGRTSPTRNAEKSPYTKVSLNGRVIAVDFNSGRQLHHIGEIRGQGPTRRFLLATLENRFFTPLDDDLLVVLSDLDGMATPDDAAQEQLVHLIDARLGFASPEA
jgi:hypothetical protein